MSDVTYSSRDAVFWINVNGLRPSTQHTCYFDGRVTTSVKPVGGKFGDQLWSDANGGMQFEFFFSPDVPRTASNREEFARLVAGIIGTKNLLVMDAGGTSRAAFPITVSADVVEDVTAQVPPPRSATPVVIEPPPPQTSGGTTVPVMPKPTYRGRKVTQYFEE